MGWLLFVLVVLVYGWLEYRLKRRYKNESQWIRKFKERV